MFLHFTEIPMYSLNLDVCTLLSEFFTEGGPVLCFRLICEIWYDITFILCWYITCLLVYSENIPNRKVHVAHMGPTWGRKDPGGPHVGHVNLAIWDTMFIDRAPG